MPVARALFVVFVVAGLLVACGSEGKLGEACDTSGVRDGECETGSICGKNSAGSLLCLKVCTDQAQCAANEDCNGVDGSSTKGCRPKDGTTTKK